jgi:hypothetical protein
MDAFDELMQHIATQRGLSPTLKRVWKFHQANPELLDLLVSELLDLKAMGWKAASVNSLFHYARWVLTKSRVPGESFALNENFQWYYARVIAILHPELNGFYEMREGALSKKGRGCDAEMGTKLEHVKQRRKDYGRRLLWKDGTAIEQGWQPSTPHNPKPVSRRPSIHGKPPVSVDDHH